MSAKKIVCLVSYYHYPEITPRAFRCVELAKEFSRRGHEVHVFVPFRENTEAREYAVRHGYQLHFLSVRDLMFVNLAGRARTGLAAALKRAGARVVSFFLCGLSVTELRYAFKLSRYLPGFSRKADMLISIGLPVGVHLGVRLALRGYKPPLVVADYGDAFYRNPTLKNNFLAFILEKYILVLFDYVTVPTADLINDFKGLLPLNRVRVIPQGFDLSGERQQLKVNNEPIKFAYAGAFYKGVRDPKLFLEYLAGLSGPRFKFYIFTDVNNTANMALLQDHLAKLSGKIEVRPLLQREELIKTLASMDFLVYLLNINEAQRPSKLLDYYLTGRPVLKVSQRQVDQQAVDKMFRRDYDGAFITYDEVKQYEISDVVDKFCHLGKGAAERV